MKRPITTINPELGDESFVATFGRVPTEHDDIALRVATHVGYVARQLRDRDVSHPRRSALLDALDAYVAAGNFPASETDHGLLPTFVDPSGVRCAVAHLVETTAGTAAMTALDRDHHNDYIADLAGDPRFVAWAADSGFTLEELAWIQPSYPPPPPAEILYVVAATGDVAVDHATPDTAARGTTTPTATSSFALVDGSVRYAVEHQSPFYGKPSLELDGAIGMTWRTSNTAYAAGIKLGTEATFSSHRGSITAGVTTDSYGPAIPRAWSLPVEVAYHHLGKTFDEGIHGGPRFALDDARTSGWNAGIDLRAKHVLCDDGRFHPRDVLVSFDVTRLADSTFNRAHARRRQRAHPALVRELLRRSPPRHTAQQREQLDAPIAAVDERGIAGRKRPGHQPLDRRDRIGGRRQTLQRHFDRAKATIRARGDLTTARELDAAAGSCSVQRDPDGGRRIRNGQRRRVEQLDYLRVLDPATQASRSAPRSGATTSAPRGSTSEVARNRNRRQESRVIATRSAGESRPGLRENRRTGTSRAREPSLGSRTARPLTAARRHWPPEALERSTIDLDRGKRGGLERGEHPRPVPGRALRSAGPHRGVRVEGSSFSR